MGLIDDFKAWTQRNSAPFTVFLVVSSVVASLVTWLLNAKGLESVWLSNSPQSPIWTFLTYPWADVPFFDGLHLMFYIFLLMWLVQVGGNVEREIGTTRFVALWFGSTLIAGLAMDLGASAMHHIPVRLMAMYLPESAVTLVWCIRNRTTSVMLYGFLPISGYWLGWATVAMDLLLYGAGAPPLGVLACVHLGVVALYASNRISFLPYGAGDYQPRQRSQVNKKEATTRGQVRYDDTYFEEVKRREKERAEQERLKKLFGDE